MKTSAAIFFLALSLFTFAEVHQVMRLPMLLAHYQEHRAQKEDISFLEFLTLHYFSDSHQDSRHQDLPFKHKHCEILRLVAAVVPGLIPTEFSLLSPGDVPPVSYESQFHCQSALTSIWQPPRQFLS